jgi:acetoin utilization protein AcuC
LVEAFRPDFVFTQLGVDSFHDDPLAHGLVTTAGFTRVLREIKTLAPRWIATGGGGYNLANVARAWTLAWGMMNDIEVPNALPDEVLPLLRRVGYDGNMLRDAALSLHRTHHRDLHAEVQQSIAYLKQHVFPVHGLSSAASTR